MADNEQRQLTLFDVLNPRPLDALLSADQIYATEDQSLFARLGENPSFDRKGQKINARDLAVCLSAFGNGPSVDGGVVAIGISNDGVFEGLKHLGADHVSDLENMGAERCASGKFITRRLAIKNAKGEDDFIVLTRIFYVEDRLVELANHDAFIRRGNRSIQLTDLEKNEVRINKGEISFEQQASLLKWPGDFREREVAAFVRGLRTTLDISPETTSDQILEMSHLGKRRASGFQPNHACTLLFANDVRSEFPGAYIHCLKYEGTAEGRDQHFDFVKERIVTGTVLEQIEGAASFFGVAASRILPKGAMESSILFPNIRQMLGMN